MSQNERDFDFTLLLDGVNEVTPEIANSLFEAGCDDATPGMVAGRTYLMFTRSATSLTDAILSAIENVHNAGISATVLRVDHCDLVTQAEIARRAGLSRQRLNQYVTGQRRPGGFPAPVCNINDDAAGATLWYWCEVAHWLCENQLVKEQVVRDAEAVAAINNVLELMHLRQNSPEATTLIMNTFPLCPTCE